MVANFELPINGFKLAVENRIIAINLAINEAEKALTPEKGADFKQAAAHAAETVEDLSQRAAVWPHVALLVEATGDTALLKKVKETGAKMDEALSRFNFPKKKAGEKEVENARNLYLAALRNRDHLQFDVHAGPKILADAQGRVNKNKADYDKAMDSFAAAAGEAASMQYLQNKTNAIEADQNRRQQ